MPRMFDLEDRTTRFAIAVVKLCRKLPRDSINSRLTGQVVGSAGSIGANYREANDALGKKDFLLRLKISRREAKEAIHWLEPVQNLAQRTEKAGLSVKISQFRLQIPEISSKYVSILRQFLKFSLGIVKFVPRHEILNRLLEIIKEANPDFIKESEELRKEALELKSILSSIIKKATPSPSA